MPTTYSTSLRLSLIATGEQSGNWGNITNVNLGTLLEQAITGYVSIAMSDANYTLSVANGADDESRNAVVRLTGALTASRNVVVPTAEKLYTIVNATSGGQSIVVKTTAGTGVTVENGYTTNVYCDGTNVVSSAIQVVASTGGVKISGPAVFASTIGVTGATTLSSTLDVTGATTFVSMPTISSVGIMPTGVILPYGGSTAPAGWLLCYGQAVSRATYAALFAIIGTANGSGDGSTTFNLPDARGRVPVGKDDMGGSAANRITNAVSGIVGTTLGATGGDQRDQSHTHSVEYTTQTIGVTAGGSVYNLGVSTGAGSTGSYGAGSSQNVQPSFISTYIIKT